MSVKRNIKDARALALCPDVVVAVELVGEWGTLGIGESAVATVRAYLLIVTTT